MVGACRNRAVGVYMVRDIDIDFFAWEGIGKNYAVFRFCIHHLLVSHLNMLVLTDINLTAIW